MACLTKVIALKLNYITAHILRQRQIIFRCNKTKRFRTAQNVFMVQMSTEWSRLFYFHILVLDSLLNVPRNNYYQFKIIQVLLATYIHLYIRIDLQRCTNLGNNTFTDLCMDLLSQYYINFGTLVRVHHLSVLNRLSAPCYHLLTEYLLDNNIRVKLKSGYSQGQTTF